MEFHQQPSRHVMVAAAPGIQRDALVSLLRAQPNLIIIATADDTSALRRMLAATPVEIMILDGGILGSGGTDLIHWLRKEYPAARCVVLANRTAQCAAYKHAGADAALLKGCLDEQLLAAIAG
ncbi:MAG: response regulator [Caldilineaceae bacterium]